LALLSFWDDIGASDNGVYVINTATSIDVFSTATGTEVASVPDSGSPESLPSLRRGPRSGAAPRQILGTL
jgi:hypothetical protein